MFIFFNQNRNISILIKENNYIVTDIMTWNLNGGIIMTYPKLVSWYYNDGDQLFTKTPQKEYIVRIYAKNEEAERIAKTGQAAVLNYGVGNDDPYFKVERQYGYTKKAKRYKDIYYKMSNTYPELEDSLKSITHKVKSYGDYVYINLAYIDNYVNPLTKTDIFLTKQFIPKSKFTIETMETLIDYHPYAMMGGEIMDYQNKEIPALLLSVKIEMPELYEQLYKKSSRVKEIDKTLTFKGKTAYLQTLNPGKVELRLGFIDRQVFYWDGHVLTNNTQAYDESELMQVITPSENTTVTIMDDMTVTSETKFTS